MPNSIPSSGAASPTPAEELYYELRTQHDRLNELAGELGDYSPGTKADRAYRVAERLHVLAERFGARILTTGHPPAASTPSSTPPRE